GRLYTPGDAEAAAHALVEVVRDAGALGTAARERAERLYDVEKTRRSYAALVEELSGVGSRVSGVGNGIALVTVMHNSERDLPRLLASVRAHLPGARVVVVDSGSSDGGAELARSNGAQVIELCENVGFGR